MVQPRMLSGVGCAGPPGGSGRVPKDSELWGREMAHGRGEGAEINLQDEQRASGLGRKRLARASSKRMQFDPVAKKAMQADLCIKHKEVNVRLMLPA